MIFPRPEDRLVVALLRDLPNVSPAVLRAVASIFGRADVHGVAGVLHDALQQAEAALDPAIAFEVMVHGMVYGLGFANGHRLQHYLSGANTDYVGARRMVNGTNENAKIAAVARVFEAALLKARR